LIYITGDTHIPIDVHKLSVANFPEQKNLTKNDFVIICGDFGGVWNRSVEEQYWVNWLNRKSFTTLFVDGNHENFAMLNKYPVSEWNGGLVQQIKPSIYHLMRGQIFTIDGYKIFTMGGAKSHDKIFRKEGRSWWPEEMPSRREYDTALENLDEHKWNVDIILTHCIADSIQYRIADWYSHDKLTNFLETVKLDCKYDKWYFGHYHINKDIDEKHTALYDWIIPINKKLV